MMNYWTNFAKNGDPNVGKDVPQWPSYNPTTRKNMFFKTPESTVETDYMKEDCDFFDGIGYHFGWR